MDIKNYLLSKKEMIDSFLNNYLPKEDSYPQEIHKAMRYSLFAGGKRLRPILSLASYETISDDSSSILPVACAIELIHTYSLIHDDLPSMDNDDFRRGKPTSHKVFGEAMAILSGDALLTMAFSMLTEDECLKRFNHKLLLQVIREISIASGDRGMVGGQVIDILSEGKEINSKTLKYIHENKTGALIKASVRVGAILANASDEELIKITIYGKNIGLAFQITDDILDVEGKKEEIGKDTGMDSAKGKKTYPGFMGLMESKKKVKELIENAIESVIIFKKRSEPLREIAKSIINRKN